MRIAAIVVGVVVMLALGVVLVGWMLPVRHHVSREGVYRAAPSAVFAALTNVADYPSWRPSVKQVVVLPAEDGRGRFREVGSDGTILFAVDSIVPDQRVVTRI